MEIAVTFAVLEDRFDILTIPYHILIQFFIYFLTYIMSVVTGYQDPPFTIQKEHTRYTTH